MSELAAQWAFSSFCQDFAECKKKLLERGERCSILCATGFAGHPAHVGCSGVLCNHPWYCSVHKFEGYWTFTLQQWAVVRCFDHEGRARHFETDQQFLIVEDFWVEMLMFIIATIKAEYPSSSQSSFLCNSPKAIWVYVITPPSDKEGRPQIHSYFAHSVTKHCGVLIVWCWLSFSVVSIPS